MFLLDDFRLCYQLICLAMAIYQISKALIEYHNYATVIESQFIESNRTILPKVTICSQHITMDGRDDRYPGGTAKYRLYNSVRMSEMVHHCRITLPNGSKSNCTEQGSEIGSVNWYYKCFENWTHSQQQFLERNVHSFDL